MANKRRQLRWVINHVYRVIGSNGKERKLRLIARTRIDGKETLLLQVQRKAAKVRK